MGKGIVYCQDCGKSLREDAFARGKAQIVEDRPYCSACRPLDVTPYNLACVYSVESKTLRDAAKKAAGDAALRHLEAALRAGYGKRPCACHKGGGIEHINKDSDIDPIRADPRLAELLRKYKPG